MRASSHRPSPERHSFEHYKQIPSSLHKLLKNSWRRQDNSGKFLASGAARDENNISPNGLTVAFDKEGERRVISASSHPSPRTIPDLDMYPTPFTHCAFQSASSSTTNSGRDGGQVSTFDIRRCFYNSSDCCCETRAVAKFGFHAVLSLKSGNVVQPPPNVKW
jgi:hypothetical protein